MRGLYTATGAMLVQQSRLEAISNNLANQRTPGFKRNEVVQTSFAEWLLCRLEKSEKQDGGKMTPLGTMAYSTAVAETPIILRQGNVESTARTLDFALVGEGFFTVQVGDEICYTRNGHFFIDAEGYLVTAEGYRVLGDAGPIYIGLSAFQITPEGEIFVGGEYSQRLALVNFTPEANLTKLGDNLFRPENPAAEIPAAPEVLSGFLESSNVELAEEMVELIQARRCYEAAQRVMITYDQILSKGANELASL